MDLRFKLGDKVEIELTSADMWSNMHNPNKKIRAKGTICAITSPEFPGKNEEYFPYCVVIDWAPDWSEMKADEQWWMPANEIYPISTRPVNLKPQLFDVENAVKETRDFIDRIEEENEIKLARRASWIEKNKRRNIKRFLARQNQAAVKLNSRLLTVVPAIIFGISAIVALISGFMGYGMI